ncbi:hypothetical protein CGQ24_06485 [Arthrobacter sp. 7749]|nr:hypothetical protein CGQ24_06485 [Arthrobacter sp. 7749]
MNEATKEHGFFRWVRELGLQRSSESWVGGVAGGVARRFGLAPILVRGIGVALCFVGGIGVLAYGLAWAVLPDEDGRIHVQEAIAGRWSSGMSGALILSIIGAVSSPSLFGWWDGGFWTLLVILGIGFLIFSRRGSVPARTPGTSEVYEREAATAYPDGFIGPRPMSSNDSSPAAPAVFTGSTAVPPDALAADAPTTPLSHQFTEGTMPIPTPGSPAPAAGFTPPIPPISKPRAPRNKSVPGYVATIVLGLAVLAFAMVVGLAQLNMLQINVNAAAVGFAIALIIIALGIIGAALKHRTGGALVGFGIVALIFALIWGGNSLRDTQGAMIIPGIVSTDSGGRENVFSSGAMDLRSYSNITEDTEVQIDNVFSSMTLTVPDNIPVAINTDGVFSSLTIDGQSASMGEGQRILNADAVGPTLELQLDGVFSSLTINVAKAEVAP